MNTHSSPSAPRPASPAFPASSPSPLRNGHVPSSSSPLPPHSTNGNGNGNSLNGHTVHYSASASADDETMSNGETRPSSMNHRPQPSSSRTGVPVAGARLYPDEPRLDRGEVVRLAIQALRDCGYTESAAGLERESGYVLEAPTLSEFREAILGGRWDESLGLFDDVGLTGTSGDIAARFRIAEQEYLELLETSQTKRALAVLRGKLAPLEHNPDRISFLSSLLMCVDPAELMEQASWDGVRGESRNRLLDEIFASIPPSVVLPPRRLAALLNQALRHQAASSTYHVQAPGTTTLFIDQSGARNDFPLVLRHRLRRHADEVWNLEWSHNGRMLATTSKDRTVIIWDIPRKNPDGTRSIIHHELYGHTEPVGNLAWSPDDLYLLSTAENVIKVWTAVPTGTWRCAFTLSGKDCHDDFVSAVRWLPDGKRFISTGEDGFIMRYRLVVSEDENTVVAVRSATVDTHPLRVFDFEVSPDGRHLLGVANCDRNSLFKADEQLKFVGLSGKPAGYGPESFRMVVFDLATDKLVPGEQDTLGGKVTSFKLSKDAKTGLVSRNPDDIQLWDLSMPEQPRLIRRLRGHSQTMYFIRSCFGGPDDNFVLSGSEDSKIYVWHRQTGELLEGLTGHERGCVNAVAWRPQTEGDTGALFASCGDDHSVILWEAPGPGDADDVPRAAQDPSLDSSIYL